MTARDADEDAVGPVLEPGTIARALIAAMRVSTPDLTVIELGGYLRVLANRRVTLARTDVERVLGTPFRLPTDLEQVMPAFRGRLVVDDDSVTWEHMRRTS
ncbi:MAG: MmoB/DmpM family protein [Polyangiales bacterium]